MKKLKLFIILSLVISLLLILTMFIPVVKYPGYQHVNQMAGLGIVLGFGSFSSAYGEIDLKGYATIILLFAYLLPIVLSILLMIFKNRNKAIGYVFGGLLIAAFVFEAIILFNVTGIAKCTFNGNVVSLKQAYANLSVGAIFGGCGALLGAASAIAYICFKYLSSKEEK